MDVALRGRNPRWHRMNHQPGCLAVSCFSSFPIPTSFVLGQSKLASATPSIVYRLSAGLFSSSIKSLNVQPLLISDLPSAFLEWWWFAHELCEEAADVVVVLLEDLDIKPER